MTTITAKSVEDYLKELASGVAVPGGGSAVALTAAQGAALLAMALHVTGAKTKQGDEEDIRGLISDLDRLRLRLQDLANADAEAFSRVMAAYKLPKDHAEAQESRYEAIQVSLQEATRVPVSVMEVVAELIELAVSVTAMSKKSVISDVGVALHLLITALKAGSYQIWINLKSIEDEGFQREIQVNTLSLNAGKEDLVLRLHEQIQAMLKS